MGIKPLSQKSFSNFTAEEYLVSAGNTFLYSHIGIDLNPIASLPRIVENYNLEIQKGCFLYYDNKYSQISFERFLELYCQLNRIKIDSPIITIYNINYNSLFNKLHSKQPNHISVFQYLRQRKITGEFLFNDIQGLKYDFNFFHNK